MTDAFNRREQSLENQFFYKVDQELIRQLRAKAEAEKGRERLALVTGIGDEAMIAKLLDAGITPETLVALSFVPLIKVARADRVIEQKERRAILDAAAEAGVEPDTVCYQILTGWLEEEPDESLVQAWHDYVHHLCETLPPEEIVGIQNDILRRSREVAQAAGGLLGLGAISKAEEEGLMHIESAFVNLPHEAW